MGQKTDTDPEKMPDETYQVPDNGKTEIPEGSDAGGSSVLLDEDDDLDEDIEVGEYEEYDSGDDDFEDDGDFKDFDDCFEDFDEDFKSFNDGFEGFDKDNGSAKPDQDNDIGEPSEDGASEESDEDKGTEKPAEDDGAGEDAEADETAGENEVTGEADDLGRDDDIGKGDDLAEADDIGKDDDLDEDDLGEDDLDEYDDLDEDDDINGYDKYDESDEYDEDDDSEEESRGLNLFTILVMLIAAAITAVYFTCNVRTVRVTGSSLYTSQEIAEQVISDDTQLMHNSVFLTVLYMTPWAPKIPFVESVRVSLDSPESITITVKDMDIAGYIPYAGKNLYFSADGIVLENSPLTVKNAAFVTGLTITKGEIGSRMEAENAGGLDLVLSALEILKKYELHTESIYLGKTGGVTMYLDQIKVQLGRTDFELKISKIAQIYPYLEGRSGTINMTNYSSSDENIILK